MTTHSGIRYTLALFKQRYMRGTSWTVMLLNFGIITANAKLFEDFFYIHLRLTLPMVIAIAIPAYIMAPKFRHVQRRIILTADKNSSILKRLKSSRIFYAHLSTQAPNI